MVLEDYYWVLYCFFEQIPKLPKLTSVALGNFPAYFHIQVWIFLKWIFYWHNYTGKHSHTSALLSVQVGTAVSAFKFQLIAKIPEEKKTSNMHKAHILSCCIHEYLKHNSLCVALPNPQGMLHTKQDQMCLTGVCSAPGSDYGWAGHKH